MGAHTVGTVRYFFWLLLCAFSSSPLALPTRAFAATGELPRAGAPRPLRLISTDGSPLAGSPSDVAWEERGGGIFFTLERGGTRNIWRAFPDPQDNSRFPAWRALPVTDLRAPRYAAQPAPLPGQRAVVCVSNALASENQTACIAQIVRFDLLNQGWTALSDGVRLYDSPRVSPDGSRVAFAGGQGATMRIYTASATNPTQRFMPDVTPVTEAARQPVWLDNSSLLVESLTPKARGLYSMAPGSPPHLVIGGGGEANILGANGIIFSAKKSASSPPDLYVIARDGSGLRVLNGTENARRPAVSPDGTTLAFDAPQNGARALWVTPLLNVPSGETVNAPRGVRLIVDNPTPYDLPVAQLSQVRPASQGIAIIGTLRGASNSVVQLEVGAGEKPRRWETLDVPFPPISPLLDAQGNRVLTFWNPPARAKGQWTFRLSLSGLGGATQSLLRVKLPLPAETPALPPKVEISRPESSAIEPLPPSVTPDLPAPKPNLLPAPDDKSNGEDLPIFPPVQAPDSSSIPPFVIPPIPPIAPTKTPDITPMTAQIPIVPIEPMRVPPVKIPPIQLPAIPPIQLPDTPNIENSAPDDSPNPTDRSADDANYGDVPAATNAPFVAQFNVSATPARMAPGQKAKVTFWGINRGTSNWETGSSGANRVRVVARWVDFSTGTRRQWNFFWLREAIAPGERTKWDFDLTAPTRPGKYKVIYGLVRVPATGEFKAPAYSAAQEAWNGEFGAIAFAVEVAPPT